MVEDPADSPRPLAEISHGPSAFEAFLDRNQKGMIVFGIALIVAAAGWIVVRGIKDSAEIAAGGVLSKSDALPELQELIKNHPGTAAAGSARLVIANKQWDDGDQDAAIATLEGFIKENSGHPAVPTAKASLASRLMQQGKKDEAAALFRELSDSPDAKFIAPYALISLGDLAKAEGKLDEAEQAYQRAQNDFGGNPFANLAAQHLKLLKFKMPVEIEAPPAPPEAKDEELPKLDFTPGASLPGSGNPLTDALGGDAPPVEAPPEEAPAPPSEEPPAPPAEGESN